MHHNRFFKNGGLNRMLGSVNQSKCGINSTNQHVQRPSPTPLKVPELLPTVASRDFEGEIVAQNFI